MELRTSYRFDDRITKQASEDIQKRVQWRFSIEYGSLRTPQATATTTETEARETNTTTSDIKMVDNYVHVYVML
ncbi:unnamed protein product [Arabis nemorensis]|uniref:Uncharacterized protein n=1 Tax=Arabis nemorensis TaxID=586526 RepID=A0A565C1B6_9BRAS|nr:unnamed protein product [Arabis nemorensis]